ncbi:MAG TPA: RidA family protein [Kofleriaceae bacterium]|jgi:enamine deaminase RidA (YjgF/YER057c/UK114 family)|nr:RidA family protein [Kofleriaceae bacterium]
MKRDTLNPTTLSRPGNYSHIAIIQSARQAHISGQIAFNATGELVGKGDLAAQTEQVYTNLGHALAAVGATWDNVFKVVTYVVGITPDKVATIRAVRAKFLGAGPFPAATMIGVTGLVHPDLLLEIEASVAID